MALAFTGMLRASASVNTSGIIRDNYRPMRMRLDTDFQPVRVDEGDELFPNGIFEFNITKLLKHIKSNPVSFPIERYQKVLGKFCWRMFGAGSVLTARRYSISVAR
jgi:hypothetical protein